MRRRSERLGFESPSGDVSRDPEQPQCSEDASGAECGDPLHGAYANRKEQSYLEGTEQDNSTVEQVHRIGCKLAWPTSDDLDDNFSKEDAR